MYRKVDMELDLLMLGSVEYKYCLHKKGGLMYEYVLRHGSHHGEMNRILKINPGERKRVAGNSYCCVEDG